jgi:hypothetical protein
MRPFRSFLLLLIFLACFTGLYYIIPGYVQLPGINVFIPAKLTDLLLKTDTVFHRPDSLKQSTIPSVVNDTTEISAPDSTHPQVSAFTANIDSLPVINPPLGGKGGQPVSGWQKGLTLPEYIDSAQHSTGQARIMFYGDSQIEGDRITSYLRQSLRKGRGGTGPGLFLPLMPVMYTRSIFIRSSSNWKRYNYLSFKNHEIENSDLGPFMTICRYMPSGARSVEPVKAWVRIVPSEFADIAVATYDNLRIFYKNTLDAVRVKVSEGDKLISQDTLHTSSETGELKIKLNRSKDIRIEFEGYVSPDIFGMSIESDSGVVVDNIPQRGSAGMEFTMVGEKNLEEIYEILKPGLFILQYGLNVVKNVRDDYSYYENGLVRQLLLLKKDISRNPDSCYKSDRYGLQGR